MTKLTNKIIAIEVPEDAPMDLNEYDLEFDGMIGTILWAGNYKIDLCTALSSEVRIVGVHPNLKEPEMDEKGFYSIEDISITKVEKLLSNKGLDISKKYVIIE